MITDEIKQYLKENLSISVETSKDYEGETISTEYSSC